MIQRPTILASMKRASSTTSNSLFPIFMPLSDSNLGKVEAPLPVMLMLKSFNNAGPKKGAASNPRVCGDEGEEAHGF